MLADFQFSRVRTLCELFSNTADEESVAAGSAAFKESSATGAASSTTAGASTDAESDAFSELAALLPQDAKDRLSYYSWGFNNLP